MNKNQDLSLKEILDLLVDKLDVKYGSFEMKIHNGKCTNFSKTKRINYTEIDSEEYMDEHVRNTKGI